MSGWEWGNPGWLWAFLVLWPYALGRSRRRGQAAVRYAPAQLAPTRGSHHRPFWAGLVRVLELAILALVVLILAQPRRIDEVPLISEPGVDLALVLDISASMQAADFSPNRLEVLKKMVIEFLKRSSGDRIAIYAFAKQTFTHTPLTRDVTAMAELVDGLAYETIDHVESGGTSIGDALLVAIDDLKRHRQEGRDQGIFLFSDGESNFGVDPELAARLVAEEGIHFYVVGVGGEEGVEVYINGQPFINSENEILITQLDDSQLRRVADVGQGRYWRAESEDVLAGLFTEVARLERTPLEVEAFRSVRSFAPEFHLGLLALFLSWWLLEGGFLRRPFQ